MAVRYERALSEAIRQGRAGSDRMLSTTRKRYKNFTAPAPQSALYRVGWPTVLFRVVEHREGFASAAGRSSTDAAMSCSVAASLGAMCRGRSWQDWRPRCQRDIAWPGSPTRMDVASQASIFDPTSIVNSPECLGDPTEPRSHQGTAWQKGLQEQSSLSSWKPCECRWSGAISARAS